MKEDFEELRRINQEVYVTDQSVIKVTEDVVFVNRYKSDISRSQYSTYVRVTVGLFGFYFSILLTLYIASSGNITDDIDLILFISFWTIPLIFLVIISWRIELPICFNKKTQKVSTWIDGELAEIEWEKFFMFATTIYAGKMRTEVLLFTLFGQNDKEYNMTIWDEASPGGLYVFLHNFMNHKEPIIVENGKMEIARGNFQFTYKELFVQRFTFRKEDNVFMRISLIFSAIFFTVPIDFLMYGLNKILPRRKIPKELLEACGLDKDYKVYG